MGLHPKRFFRITQRCVSTSFDGGSSVEITGGGQSSALIRGRINEPNGYFQVCARLDSTAKSVDHHQRQRGGKVGHIGLNQSVGLDQWITGFPIIRKRARL